MKTTRRKFVASTVKVTLMTSLGVPLIINSSCSGKTPSDPEASESESKSTLQFSQVPLSYGYEALEPSIDAQTMEIHYTKHHAGYVKNINTAIAEENVPYASDSELFANVSKVSDKVRNNSGGAWNHNFFWQIMGPSGEGPSGKILEAINEAFGSLDSFKEEFTKAAMGRFGSGWAWLVNDNGVLKIGSTPNQDNPLMDVSDFKGTPLLALDVWEHAYYLKYQNKRNEYISNWWNVIRWEEVAAKLG